MRALECHLLFWDDFEKNFLSIQLQLLKCDGNI